MEASITELQAQIVDLTVSKDTAGDAAAEAASTAAELARPTPAPEPASSSDEVSEVRVGTHCSAEALLVEIKLPTQPLSNRGRSRLASEDVSCMMSEAEHVQPHLYLEVLPTHSGLQQSHELARAQALQAWVTLILQALRCIGP